MRETPRLSCLAKHFLEKLCTNVVGINYSGMQIDIVVKNILCMMLLLKMTFFPKKLVK